MNTQVKDLLDFIDNSPSPYHAVKSIEDQLLKFGFKQLDEKQKWTLSSRERYYVIRDDSSIIFFTLGEKSIAEPVLKFWVLIQIHRD